DACFGSLGSFFNFSPRQGAFEVNPPFAPAMIARTREHMHKLLEEATGPLRFVVAVANWPHPEVEALSSSPFRTSPPVVVGQDDQVWMDGREKRRAPVELLLLVLQNHAAQPVTRDQLERLRQSCTGEAKPMGPRKRPLPVEALEVDDGASAASAP
ncbi:mRNA (2'-O-methyladenosine-N(6)-)-methyltransferase (Cap-specific adenosine methyltransferase) (CAPAM) (Phosphorylated CTD-interacting factor 1), partial [Durusdinium trenchii]